MILYTNSFEHNLYTRYTCTIIIYLYLSLIIILLVFPFLQLAIFHVQFNHFCSVSHTTYFIEFKFKRTINIVRRNIIFELMWFLKKKNKINNTINYNANNRYIIRKIKSFTHRNKISFKINNNYYTKRPI